MRRVEVTEHPVNEDGIKKRGPTQDDYDQIVTAPAKVVCADEVVGAIYPLDQLGRDPSTLFTAVRDIKYVRDWRTGGLRTNSRIFGYRPREALRKDFCSVTTLAREFPDQHGELLSWGAYLDELYKQTRPDVYAFHQECVADILPEWRMPDSVFTSGIVNDKASLFYHQDAGNFKGTWNAMVVFQRDTYGGLTVVPKYRIAFAYPKPSAVIFPAQATWHAVTKIKKKSVTGYRYSIVYYSLKQMCNCGTVKEEVARIRKVKTERERRRSSKNRVKLENELVAAMSKPQREEFFRLKKEREAKKDD